MDKPSNIQFGLLDRPPFFKLILLGLQQFFVLASYFAITVIVYRAGNFSSQLTSNAVSLSMIALAISGLLQVMWRGPIGSGYLALPVTSAIYLIPSILAVKEAGLAGLITMTVFAGIVEIIFAVVFKYLRIIFTSTVTGLIILLVGFELSIVGIRNLLNVDHVYMGQHVFYNFLAGLITIIIAIAMSVWAKGSLRLFPVLISLIIGALVSWPLHILSPESINSVKQAFIFHLPYPHFFAFSFKPDLIIPFIFAAIAAGLRTNGTIVTAQTINNSKWTHADFVSVRKGIIADGIGNIIAGLLALPGISVGPSSVGVSQISGATSRSIVFSAAIWLIVFSLFPILASIYLLIPLSVIGAILLFNGAFMMLAGIKLITVTELDTRKILVVGVSFIFGTSYFVFEQFYQKLPKTLLLFTSSALSICSIIAIVLTLIFRIGIRVRLKLGAMGDFGSTKDFHHFLKEKLSSFKLSERRLEEILLVNKLLIEELSNLEVDMQSLDVNLSFDDVKLIMRYEYTGQLLNYKGGSGTVDQYLIEEQAFYKGLQQVFAGPVVDKISSERSGEQSIIRLTFMAV